MNPSRRRLLLTGAATIGAVAIGPRLFAAGMGAGPAVPEGDYPVKKTDAEWKKELNPEQYAVLRHESTESPYSSPLNSEHRDGLFSCAACAQKLFTSKAKFDSGTGWPSFFIPLTKTSVAERHDGTLGMERIEIHCNRCGGHLGHVFDDGPKPTGLRYCMNGVAMAFAPGAAPAPMV